MVFYALAETDDGFMVIQFAEGETAEDAALKESGVVVDSGPYISYEEAYEALEQLEVFDKEDES